MFRKIHNLSSQTDVQKDEKATLDDQDITSHLLFPKTVPIIVVQGAVLMPGTTLPIPVDEKDVAELLETCEKHDAFVGVLQPKQLTFDQNGRLPLFQAGTLGQVLELKDFDEDHKLIHIRGVCRFHVDASTIDDRGRRYADVSYDHYVKDVKDDAVIQIDRERLFKILHSYFTAYDIHPNWQEIESTSDRRLIAALATLCPLEASEKQAILEQPDFKKQSDLFIDLLEMSFSFFTTQNQSFMVH